MKHRFVFNLLKEHSHYSFTIIRQSAMKPFVVVFALSAFALCLYAQPAQQVQKTPPAFAADTSVQSWKNLRVQTATLMEEGQYAKALPVAQQALRQAEQEFGGKDTNYARSLNDLSEVCFYLERPESDSLTFVAYTLCKQIFKTPHRDLALSINNMGVYYQYRLGKNSKAEPYYEEALAMYHRLFTNNNPALLEAQTNLASVYEAHGRFTDAERLYTEALAVQRRLPDSLNALSLFNYLTKLATFYLGHGRYAEALRLTDEYVALARQRAKGNDFYMAFALSQAANTYFALNIWKDVKALVLELFPILRRLYTGDHPSIQVAIVQMAYLDALDENFHRADSLYNEQLAMAQRLYKGDHMIIAKAFNDRAIFDAERGNYAKAASMQEAALDMARRLKLRDNALMPYLFNLAQMYMAMNTHYATTDSLHREMLAIARRNAGWNSDTYFYRMAMFYVNHQRLREAENVFTLSLTRITKFLNAVFPLRSEIEKQSVWENAIKGAFVAYNNFALLRKQSNPKVIGQIFDNQLATKGILLNATTKLRQRILNSGDTALVQQFKHWQSEREVLAQYLSAPDEQLQKDSVSLDSLRAAVTLLERELTKRSEAFAAAFDTKRFGWRDVQRKLKKNEAAVELIEFPKWNFRIKTQDSSTQQYKRSNTDTIYYAALIVTRTTKLHPELVLLPNGAYLKNIALDEYKRKMKQRSLAEQAINPDTESYKAFWDPIAQKLHALGIKRIFLSPDGVYNQINIQTLWNAEKQRYVIDELDIHNVTSTRDILSLALTPTRKKKLLESDALRKDGLQRAELFGFPQFDLDTRQHETLALQIRAQNADTRFPGIDNAERTSLAQMHFAELPGTRLEIESIGQLLGASKWGKWDVQTHLGEQALEEAVKAVQSPRLLHIATHGFFLPDAQPKNTMNFADLQQEQSQSALIRSGLVFAGAESNLHSTPSHQIEHTKDIAKIIDDGILTAFEAMNLNLDKTELVVLSACETGLGSNVSGEGVYGLQRAFKVAGAKAIIMSLWNVSDEATMHLMKNFYEKWQSGKPKREAFREAQFGLRALYAMPYYWGAFVMVGE